MTNRTRFCVLFCGVDDALPIKTRLLHSDSDKEDIRLIWKQIYEEEAPVDAELIIGENCVYKLEDEEDLLVFLAQAEDQYKLLPSHPLKVVLGNSVEYFRQRNSTPAKEDRCSPFNMVTPHREANSQTPDVATDLSKKTSIIDTNRNNNNRHNRDDYTADKSPQNYLDASDKHPEVKTEPQASWNSTNSLMSLYNRYRAEEHQKPALASPHGSSMPNYSKTIGGVIDSITSASAMHQSMNLPTRENGFNSRLGGTEASQAAYENPYAAYTKHLAKALSGMPATDLSKPKEPKSEYPETSTSGGPGKSAFNLPAYSAFMNSLQDQRLMQGSPSASYILQTIFNNHMKAATGQKPDAQKGLADSRLGSPYIDQKSALSNAFMSPHMMVSPNNTTSRSMHENRSSSLLSSLAHHNNNSLLSYMNGSLQHGLHRNFDVENGLGDSVKKTQKRRRRNDVLNENGKPMDTGKRMRSSVSQSNIEYHYQRALDYSQMAQEEQKMQNSAHRSHWKHLLFVAKRSPRFLEQYKHAKYDEWSSEARDIFAICQPDKYMWSFLTLSKQGDMLCKRIIQRIEDLKNHDEPEKPDWCPETDVLLRAQTRARERLNQLQRILYSRSINQEVKATEKANELEKFQMQEKNMALVTAYHQRQQELLQNHQAMMKHAANYQQQIHQPQEPQRPPALMPAVTHTTHCSSLTSSPISMASPAFEEHSTGSGCSESPNHQPEIDPHHEGNLVIAEEKDQPNSPNVTEELEISPRPFIASKAIGLTSPLKWSGIEQTADV